MQKREIALRYFCDLYKLKNLVRELNCFKNPDKCIDLFLKTVQVVFKIHRLLELVFQIFTK